MALSRKFLEGLLAEFVEEPKKLEEVVSKIAETHSETLRVVVKEVDELKEVVKQRETDIETLKTTADSKTKEEIAKIEANYAKEKAELANKLETIEIDTILTREIETQKAVDLETVKKLVDIEAIRASKDRTNEIVNQIKALKEGKGFLFEKAEETKTIQTGAEAKGAGVGQPTKVPTIF